jgi:malate synthase
MQTYQQHGQLKVAAVLSAFLSNEALPGSGVAESDFWASFEQILVDLIPQNQALLDTRDSLQAQIDQFHQNNADCSAEQYKDFLKQIGYLVEPPADFKISTDNVDPEIATLAGPQLVVPINNARYALNAANARWGSLYDAAYGTDVISQDNGAEKGSGYNPVRGQKVIEFARHWLDVIAPLETGSHSDSVSYYFDTDQLSIVLQDNTITGLLNQEQCIGYSGNKAFPSAIVLIHNGLHIELQFDKEHSIGKTDPTGLKDILVESALTTIMDCEDSVAAVDAVDKTLVYRNWLGLMLGTLSTDIRKGGSMRTRYLAEDRRYQSIDGSELTLNGRSLMFVRNVGHLMTNDAILFQDKPIPEGIMDAMITSLIGKHDLLGNGKYKNSAAGSIYIVKPKMHGPEEVAFADTLFARVEQALAMPENTLKMGIMDEERRTSINLKGCIKAAQQRAVFINTGFLDRTGDEIHTSMLMAPFAPKAELKARPWIGAYEKANVVNGLVTGMSGKAQIGKGMWPIPDHMQAMMQNKQVHPQSGANTAWVPSPTAATLHALHYHQIDVFGVRMNIETDYDGLDDILTVPVMSEDMQLSEAQIQNELENNVQGILGYVVRWVHQGIGCSKVPDIDNVGLMEDRATLRISSQHIANWLAHRIVTETQVQASLERMAVLVDSQNAGDPEYIAMTPDTADSIAFQAAAELIFKGKEQPNGYTEPVLHAKRKEMKLRLAS